MIFDQCPYCGVRHIQIEPVANAGALLGPSGSNENWIVHRCLNPNCKGLILIRQEQRTNEILGTYPAGHYQLPDVTIPDEIRKDYSEAGTCLDAGCYKASAVMTRRLLQQVLGDQRCNQHKLVEQIDHAPIPPASSPAMGSGSL